MLGRGSFARVFVLGGVDDLCVKIASGGRSTTDSCTCNNSCPYVLCAVCCVLCAVCMYVCISV